MLFSDDLGRNISGYRDALYFGRWISYYLSPFVHTSRALADISPLTQLFACAVCALAALCLIRVTAGAGQFSRWSYAAVIPLALSPYFLQCLSYVFDAPYMALSLFFPIAPLLFRHKKIWIYAIAAFFGNLFMCETYQASAGIFPMLVLLLCYLDWAKGVPFKEIGRFLLASVLAYGAALGLFWILLHLFALQTDYTVEHAAFAENLQTVFYNYRSYFHLLRTDFKRVWKILIACIFFLFLLLTTLSSKRGKPLSLLLGCGLLCCMALLQFGTYPLLREPITCVRSMSGFGAFAAMTGVAAVNCSSFKWIGYPAKFCTLFLGWCFLAYAALYGNALKMQNDYIDNLVQTVVSDIVSMDVPQDNGAIHLWINFEDHGDKPYAPDLLTNRAYTSTPILQRTLACSIAHQRAKFSTITVLNFSVENFLDELSGELSVLSDNSAYTIYGKDSYVYVCLK